MAVNERITNLVIRGRDEYSRLLKNIEKQQKDVAESGVQAQRKLNLEYSIGTRRALTQTQSEIKKLAGEFRALTKAEGDNRAQIAQVVMAKAQLQVKAQQLKAELNAVRASTAALTGAQRGSFVEFSRNATVLNTEAKSAGNTAAQLNILAAASQKAATAQKTLATQAVRTNAAVAGGAGGRANRGRGDQQDIAAFGLRPWQLTNLGYQVNDVISGLAMGQRPMQVLAQQAGQFIQIWPQTMVVLAKGIPILLGTTAALSPFIAAIVRMRTEANTLQHFTRNLAFLADGSRYSAEGLTEVTTALNRMGVSFDAARNGVLALVKEGFSEAQIRAVSEMAQNLSKLTGGTFEEELTRLGKAFGGNATTVRELDRELQFLTADQLENIYNLERQSKRTEALALAQQALTDKLKASKREMTPFEQAMKNIAEAWNALIEAISSSGLLEFVVDEIAHFIRDLEKITREIKDLAEFINRLFNGPTLADQISQVDEKLAQLRATLNEGLSDNARSLGFDNENSPHRRQIEAEIAVEEERRAALIEAQQKLEKAQRDSQRALEENTAALNGASDEARKKGVDLGFGGDSSGSGDVNLSDLVDRIIAVESGGNARARNPNSTAVGLGQFIESTWLRMFKQYFPDRAEGLTNSAILAYREDAALSRQMIELLARENALALQKAGVETIDAAALYLAHFLGPQGAVATLRAAPDTPTSSFLSSGQINANQSILQGKTARDVYEWAQKKMGITEGELALNTRLNEIDAERLKTQKDYLEGYQKRIADQKFEMEMASESARQAAIQKAIRDEELRAQEAGVQLTKDQVDLVASLAASAFDRQNVETRINELMERRSQLAESLQIAQAAGDRGQVSKVIEEISQTEDELREAINAAIAFYEALGGPAADAAILKLKNYQTTLGEIIRDLKTQFLPDAEELNERLAETGSNAFSAFAEAIANGENAWDSFKTALITGLGEVIVEIGKAIVKQALFNAISGGTAGGGIGGAIAGGIAGLFHSGGIVGLPSASGGRMVNPAAFAGAARYHSGGVIGSSGAKEVPIVALEGEEVLTENDPRHARNGGGGSNVKIVNVIDPNEVMEASLATEPGQRAVMNFIASNPRKVRQALGL